MTKRNQGKQPFSKAARERFERNAPGWTLERIPHADQQKEIVRKRQSATNEAAPYAMPAPVPYSFAFSYTSIPPAFLSRLIGGRDLDDVGPEELRILCLSLAWYIAHLGPLLRPGKTLARGRNASASAAPGRKNVNRGTIETEIRAIQNDPAKATWPSKRIAWEVHDRIKNGSVPIIRGKGARGAYSKTTVERIVREVMAENRAASKLSQSPRDVTTTPTE